VGGGGGGGGGGGAARPGAAAGRAAPPGAPRLRGRRRPCEVGRVLACAGATDALIVTAPGLAIIAGSGVGRVPRVMRAPCDRWMRDMAATCGRGVPILAIIAGVRGGRGGSGDARAV
jgi:hypothetical protein